jgi:hypothetical protein
MPSFQASLPRIAAAGFVSLGLLTWIQARRNRRYYSGLHEVAPSPLDAVLPKLNEAEVASLAYPPNYFPGARDVQTPWGSIRVYEFGPEDGKKVLFVHGISTPCLSLGGLANHLVERGCRVMLFGKPFPNPSLDRPVARLLSVPGFRLGLAYIFVPVPVHKTSKRISVLIGWRLNYPNLPVSRLRVLSQIS